MNNNRIKKINSMKAVNVWNKNNYKKKKKIIIIKYKS